MKKILLLIRKKRLIAKMKARKQQEEFMQMYFMYLYKKQDEGKLEIPYFIKAQETIEELKIRGIYDDVYEHILKKGVA